MQTVQEKYRYNPFLQYGNELETIISEKEYDADVADMLRLSFPIMVEYYGHEYKDILFDALRKISIEIPKDNENMYDIVTRHYPDYIEKKSKISAVNDGELKRAAGVHSTFPIFSVENGEICLLGKSEIVSILVSSNKLETLATFVHELSHAFKSYQNSMNLIQNENGENILVSRSGISNVYSSVYMENGKIVVEDIQEENVGLEEGINTYDENKIMNRILSIPVTEIPESCRKLRESLILPEGKNSYVSGGYRQETICADKLLNKCKLEQTVRKDQFMGTNNCEHIYNYIVSSPQNSWKILNSKIDLAVQHTYARYQHVFDSEWFEEHKSEIIENLQNIHDLLDECATKRKRTKFNNIKNIMRK